MLVIGVLIPVFDLFHLSRHVGRIFLFLICSTFEGSLVSFFVYFLLGFVLTFQGLLVVFLFWTFALVYFLIIPLFKARWCSSSNWEVIASGPRLILRHRIEVAPRFMDIRKESA